MPIFNSLGSNYDWGLGLKTLFARNRKTARADLISLLQEKYGGKVVLLYKGREAITLALKSLMLPSDSYVAVNGFICYAVCQAITAAGLTPYYLDIGRSDLNFSGAELERAIGETAKIKVVIIQNTLGYPVEIGSIAAVGRQHNLILIEDLAHSPGARYLDGREVGTVGDFAILSFSQDKMIDGVSGGALIVRNKKYRVDLTEKPARASVNRSRQLKDRFYPFFTWLVRTTYAAGVGKIIHRFLKQADILPRPIDDAGPSFHHLPSWQCSLAKTQLDNLPVNLKRREKIASIYAQKLNPQLTRRSVKKIMSQSANLRFPIFTERRGELLAFLKKYGIHLSDIWYDAPVSPTKYLPLTNYKQNQCPNAEATAQKIMNLPTHINVSPAEANRLINLINLWLKSFQK